VSREAVHSQASAALRVAIHLDRNEFGRRYLQSIAVVRRRNAVGPVQATLAVSFDQGGQTREWPGYPQLSDELGHPVLLEAPLAPRNLEQDLARSPLSATASLIQAPRPAAVSLAPNRQPPAASPAPDSQTAASAIIPDPRSAAPADEGES
jgi:hypothetical protein